MWAERYLAWDTETTGLGSSARIIELGVVLFEYGEPVDEWGWRFFPPDVDWDDSGVRGALDVNQLTLDDLQGSPTFADAFSEVYEQMRRADVWVAHNSEFDARMLRQEMQRLGDFRLNNIPRWLLCTQQLSRELAPRLRNHKLATVAEHWGVEQPDAHRAVIDALTCGRVLAEMFGDALLPLGDEQMAGLHRRSMSARGKRY